LSAAEGDSVLPGTYWRVVVLLHEGTAMEVRDIYTGTLSVDNPGNSSPGSSGADWATVAQILIP